MQKRLAYLPLVILWIMSVYTICIVLTTNITIGYNHYIGFGALAVATALCFFRQNVATIGLGIVLLTGCLNVSQFLPSTTTAIIGTKSLAQVSFQPYLFLIFIFYLGINFKYLKSFFGNE